MPDLVRRILKVFVCIAGSCLLLALIWLGINWFDESLTPEASAMLAIPANPYSSRQNSYIALVGHRAPATEDPVTFGQKIIDEYNQRADKLLADPDASTDYARRKQPDLLVFVGDLKKWEPRGNSLWEHVRGCRAEVEQLSANNAELYARYRGLWSTSGYMETARPGTVMPLWHVDSALRTLFLADVATRVQTAPFAGKRASLEDLRSDIFLWRAVLRGNGSLISKMIAATSIHADLLLVADMLADPATDLRLFDGDMMTLVEPFPESDWHITEAWPVEFRFINSTMNGLSGSRHFMSDQNPGGKRNTLSSKFFKPHATVNQEAELTLQRMILSSADPAHWSEALRVWRDWVSGFESRNKIRSVYNPIGRVLLMTGDTPIGQYIERVYDVAAWQRVVRLEYGIRSEQIAPADVGAYMAKHPEWATHLMDRQPFKWDEKSRRLEVVGADRRANGKRYSVVLRFLNPE